ncbi:hypothetical protein Cpir12675_005463 [Ceratocystis pirilliformis]|uniref:non-specific serine/threonine protein kinase n=1 Tax=Ceratocystis pirilliformis TaxID=259994 RepID=A0ABR3YQK4_9PEZI
MFDIHDELDKLARALVGYATLDDDTMGLDTFVERRDGHRYATLDDASGKETRLLLDKPMLRQKVIVCRGTTCYKTQDSHAARFWWASDKQKPEVEQLKPAEAMGGEGVARVVAHRRITIIAEMREGLRFSANHCLRGEDVHFDDPLTTMGMSTKRKYSADHSSGDAPGSKRLRSTGQKSKLAIVLNDQLSISNTKPSLYTPGEGLWENRIYSCLVVSPAGSVIGEFRTIKELLESERDAIKTHRSLYVSGKILHRDISPNNIIITNPETVNGFKGMLTDLDLAEFMAMEVLRKTDHTYRHDLESFFYVFLWMCARQAWSNGFTDKQNPLEYSALRKWEIGSFTDIANAKRGDMTVDGLKDITEKFPEALDVVKPLCLNIRKILFHFDKDERMRIRTPIGDLG